MRPQTTGVISPAAPDPNGISLSQTPAAGGAQDLTITGALADNNVATLDIARQVIITSTGDDTGIAFTVVGTSRDGDAQSEVVTGASGAAAATTLDYKTVSQVQASGDTAAAVEVGTNDTFASQWFRLDHSQNPFSVGFAVEIDGTIGYNVEFTHDEPAEDALAFNDANVAGETTNQAGSITTSVAAIRLKVNSFTVGATANLRMNQAGLNRD